MRIHLSQSEFEMGCKEGIYEFRDKNEVFAVG